MVFAGAAKVGWVSLNARIGYSCSRDRVLARILETDAVTVIF
jgi:hypothetical protein